MEDKHAPEGKENWFVMINAPAMQHADWDKEVNQLREAVIEKLNRMLGVNLKDHIEVEEVLTPAGIQQRTDSYLGSLYGTSSNSKWAAFLRQANFSSKIGGLYFTGGSVHPGGGGIDLQDRLRHLVALTSQRKRHLICPAYCANATPDRITPAPAILIQV